MEVDGRNPATVRVYSPWNQKKKKIEKRPPLNGLKLREIPSKSLFKPTSPQKVGKPEGTQRP